EGGHDRGEERAGPHGANLCRQQRGPRQRRDHLGSDGKVPVCLPDDGRLELVALHVLQQPLASGGRREVERAGLPSSARRQAHQEGAPPALQLGQVSPSEGKPVGSHLLGGQPVYPW
ncbi:unnamed protein product, partial [Ectocarpus sp. 12 AP-2014]